MQFGFFQVISYIMPFTYAIHAQGAIIFGIGGGVNILANNLYILQMAGILCIFAVVFVALGLVVSKRRQRELLYGTANPKKCYKAIKNLKLNDKYVNDKTRKAVWAELPNDEIVSLKKEVLILFPQETKFK
jgi:putative membrane protein